MLLRVSALQSRLIANLLPAAALCAGAAGKVRPAGHVPPPLRACRSMARLAMPPGYLRLSFLHLPAGEAAAGHGLWHHQPCQLALPGGDGRCQHGGCATRGPKYHQWGVDAARLHRLMNKAFGTISHDSWRGLPGGDGCCQYGGCAVRGLMYCQWCVGAACRQLGQGLGHQQPCQLALPDRDGRRQHGGCAAHGLMHCQWHVAAACRPLASLGTAQAGSRVSPVVCKYLLLADD